MNKLKKINKFVLVIIVTLFILSGVVAYTAMQLFSLWQASIAFGLNSTESKIELNTDNLNKANEFIQKDKSIPLDLSS